MPDHIANRDVMIAALREELVGPAATGQEIDCASAIVLSDSETAYRPYRQLGSGDEILQRYCPTKRYGVGVLYPRDAQREPAELEGQLEPPEENAPEAVGPDPLTSSALKDCEAITARAERKLPEADSDDFDLSAANSYRPSSMAVSLLVTIPADSGLSVIVTGGRYRSKPVQLLGKDREWWLRSPVRCVARFRRQDFPIAAPALVNAHESESENCDGFDVRIELFARPQTRTPDTFLVTVCLVNRQETIERLDSHCLFQSHFVVKPEAGTTIEPYPQPKALDEEERTQELLYRDRVTYAVGHGCAADWNRSAATGQPTSVSAECLPIYEAPSITPNIRNRDNTPLVAAMRPLAGLVDSDDGMTSLEHIVNSYDEWISSQENEAKDLKPPTLRPAATRHLTNCRASLARMRAGLALLSADPMIARAFQLANRAILIQQVRARREARIASFDATTASLAFNEPYQPLDLESQDACDCAWRAFQIAFILCSLGSTANATDPDRELVELIWFPTGGGKTEAYLGLAAFSIFLRRLRNPADTGVQALMRYTLRLLTAQQFQRAARLVCAMESVRHEYTAELGTTMISIGIWLGGSTTPNRRAEALSVLRELARQQRGENKFLLDRCPWCGAQMGPVDLARKGKGKSNVPRVIGYEQRNGTVAFACPDHQCRFHESLPLFVIDDDIYEVRPDLVIGTVDKFAQLAWRPEARSLFGIAVDGSRPFSPPNLIIQDELHLISGPLGSMVGLFEPVIEELCTDRRQGHAVRPKIVSSTATIRSYSEQVLSLYARSRTALFPPAGLNADDSFFARIACDESGVPERGRIYVGVHAPGLGSLQTAQVRTFAALLQGPQLLSQSERDPWWTLLLFFNSLRELGTTLTLFQSDVPDLLRGALMQRRGLDFKSVRQIRKMLELTGRLPGDEVSKAISTLEVPTDSHHGQAVDVCLASNIIEVGVDIDRLSLMAVVGQPKTTSQYIQVTGRVGRKRDRPGLVVTIYAASKPRDRSHFEKFRSYHERLYAQVEPTSVTPFSRPALDRAAHAVIASYVRQLGNQDNADSPYPFPEDLTAAVGALLESRAELVDPDELPALQRTIQKRLSEWRRWQRLAWSGSLQADDMPLMRPAGAYVPPDKARVSWATPQSLRNVDAECQAEITQLYRLGEDGDA